MISLTDVRMKCVEGRFFSYDNWRDNLCVPPAILLIWVFVNLGWSGNAVSWLSGIVTIVGAFLISTKDSTLIFLGTCSYGLFYLLDYADGGVARYRKEAGIYGQYTDWIMHSISAISISTGIFAGAINQTHDIWLIPLGVLFILASSLQLDRYSLGWWSICMQKQYNTSLNKVEFEGGFSTESAEVDTKGNRFWLGVKILSNAIFHENYAIFVFPLLALLNLLFPGSAVPDFRVLLVVLGGTVYFSFVVHDILLIGSAKKLDKAYAKLFYSTKRPRLPAEHFFK